MAKYRKGGRVERFQEDNPVNGWAFVSPGNTATGLSEGEARSMLENYRRGR